MYKQKVCKKQNTEYILFAVLFISFFLLISQLNGSNWENDSENLKDELGTSKIDSIFNSESNSITSPNFNTRSTKKLEGISQWDSNVLASYPFKTSGCTIGDLDLSRDGNEIVTVNGDGQVAMVYKTKSNIWESITLWQGQGELITPVSSNRKFLP
jgi:hypothetical protein